MDWIAVHSKVLGGKLRGLWKKVGCSEAEALGALTILWLWSRNNATETGELKNTDESDIVNALKDSLSPNVNANVVVQAMIEEGWLDKVDGILYVHDWAEWQSYWYAYQKKKAADAERKRIERARKKEAEQETPEKPPDEKPKKKKGKATKDVPEKVTYAEFVKMFESEHDKLVEQYGTPFTDKCIEVLDNYKGSKGKTYKSDYRAVLSWVAEKVAKEYPHLKTKPDDKKVASTGNTFEEYRNLWN